MKNDIETLQEKIESLPKGYISNKTIGGKVRHYLQWTDNGKIKSQYIPDEDYEKVKLEIEKRKVLQKQLKTLQNKQIFKNNILFETNVICGESLKTLIHYVKDLDKRDRYKILNDYLYGVVTPRICSVYGLRRTGKTTMLFQAKLRHLSFL